MKGRGASWNPQNRFERLEYVADEEAERDESAPRTLYLRDPTRTIIATNDSPDVGFEASINPYRGCEHGCIYCFARPTHVPQARAQRRRERVVDRTLSTAGGTEFEEGSGVRGQGGGLYALTPDP